MNNTNPTQTRLQALASILVDQQWHTSTELAEKVSHRFGASILELRKGKHDGTCWVIEGEAIGGDDDGEWRYRLVGYAEDYKTKVPHCPKCGTEMVIEDARRTGHSGKVAKASKQPSIVDELKAQLAKQESTIEWQADIIRRLEADLKRAKGQTLNDIAAEMVAEKVTA